MDNTYVKECLSYLIASIIHEEWRKKRIVESNKTSTVYKSCWETTNDTKFIYNIISKKNVDFPYKNTTIASTNKLTVDIANLDYQDLPYDLAHKNLTLAKLCLELVFDKVVSSQIISKDELNDLAYSIYMKGNAKTSENESTVIANEELQEIEKEEYKQMLISCIDIIKNYSKGSIHIDDLKESFSTLSSSSSTNLNILDTAKFLKIDTKPLKPIIYLQYSNVQSQDLYWNTDEYTGILTYLNTNGIKNIWFIDNYYKYINSFDTSNIGTVYKDLSDKVKEYENKPKWLVKSDKNNVFKKFVGFIRKNFLEKKIIAEIEQYENNKKLLKFISDYMEYTNSINKIKERYVNYNKNGIALINIKNEKTGKDDTLTIYSNGTLIYTPYDFWNKPSLSLDINIGSEFGESIIKFLNSSSCKDIVYMSKECLEKLEDTPTINKVSTIKKVLFNNNTMVASSEQKNT